MNHPPPCATCEHYRRARYGDRAKCAQAPRVIPERMDLVSGHITSMSIMLYYCETQRAFDCGPQGRFWTPRLARKSWFRRWSDKLFGER